MVLKLADTKHQGLTLYLSPELKGARQFSLLSLLMNRTKKQHYVPRVLLSKFCVADKPQIWTYDKSNSNTFRQNVKDAAEENCFYDIEFDDEILSLEEILSYKENHWSQIIEKICSSEKLSRLTSEELEDLARFFAVQSVRTKQHREEFKNLTDQIREVATERFPEHSDSFAEQFPKVDKPRMKAYGMKSLLECGKLVPHFLNKCWLLFKITDQSNLLISDSPVVLDNNSEADAFRGKLGYGVPGIEIYMPLSPKLAIGLYCPSILHKMDQDVVRFEIENRGNPIVAKTRRWRDFLSCAKSGDPIELTGDNLIRLNSLQIITSGRFLFSNLNDFELANKMISDDSRFRKGRGITID